ncbi:hypothetical protein GCWU000282_03319 [Catonella morbi ATCC 51271]|uniref:Uncharacterized protein n=1 Tax=Catonella morbi ATCC 51271 TaxID=592026 RepID=V2XH45_9FIRM|nr:hypothetical protein GCWU000282_03319 [Catonella morbi ATCC 51271]
MLSDFYLRSHFVKCKRNKEMAHKSLFYIKPVRITKKIIK